MIEVIENNEIKQQIIKKAVDTVIFYKVDIVSAWNDVFEK